MLLAGTILVNINQSKKSLRFTKVNGINLILNFILMLIYRGFRFPQQKWYISGHLNLTGLKKLSAVQDIPGGIA